MKRLKIHNSAGDTIVEVMIVLAVLGLAFAIAYATASHGLIQSRNAEEHSEALGIINSQVELVRSAVAQQTDPAITSSFCIPDPTKPTNIHPFASSPLSYTVPPSATADSASGYLHYGSSAPAGCISNIFYHESITYKPNIIDPAQSYLD